MAKEKNASPDHLTSLGRQLIKKTALLNHRGKLHLAVSGGPDSASLVVLSYLAELEADVYHVNHGINKDSDIWAEKVRELARRYGYRFFERKIVVEKGPNLEARLRHARLGALPANASFGHTMDDQAETIIINLMRGAHLKGLSGMELNLRHPILSLRRSETRKLCEDEGIDFVKDPSNKDMVFVRNRVRHQVVPLLNEIAKRDVVPILYRMSQQIRHDSDYIESQLEGLAIEDAKGILELPVALMTRFIRDFLRGDSAYSPSTKDIFEVISVIKKQKKAVTLKNSKIITFKNNKLIVKEG